MLTNLSIVAALLLTVLLLQLVIRSERKDQ